MLISGRQGCQLMQDTPRPADPHKILRALFYARLRPEAAADNEAAGPRPPRPVPVCGVGGSAAAALAVGGGLRLLLLLLPGAAAVRAALLGATGVLGGG